MSGFHHRLALERIGADATEVRLAAGPAAREQVRARFDLLSLDRLEARLRVRRIPGGAEIEGVASGDVAQRCVASGDRVETHVEEPIRLRFLELPGTAEEIELSADDLDVMPIEDGAIDLGEAVVQSLALALPQYPRREDVAVPGLLSEAAAERLSAADPAGRSPFSILRGR